MATEHQLPWRNRNLERHIWNGTWAAITSRFTSRIATRGWSSSSSESQLETTAFIVPLSTVTVFDTVIQTTFVTVQASSLAGLQPTSSNAQSSRSPIISPASSSTPIPRSLVATTRETLPSGETGGPQSNFPSSTTYPSVPLVMTSGSATPESTSGFIGKVTAHRIHKKAIVGGLSGTIAGLLLIGVLVCLVLRRRRRKQAARGGGYNWAASDDALLSYAEEKGFISSVALPRPGNAVTRDSPAPAFQSPPHTAPAIDEDHRMIRMSTCHWPRPFALGAGEGYRETVPAGQLHCTNPDLSSRPSTPQTMASTTKTFFSRQRALFAASSRSQPQQQHPLAQELPTIKLVNPALSRECVARYSSTPSFRSYRTISTVQVVQHHTPDDPFLTPTSEEPVAKKRVQRPSIIRNVSTSRTLSRIGSLLHHSSRNRSGSCLEAGVRDSSHYSVDTDSSARYSGRSDPFDLDRQSRNWNLGNEGRPGSHFGSRSHILYEGT